MTETHVVIILITAIITALAVLLFGRSGYSTELVACEPQYVTGDSKRWAWREIDHKKCWYRGAPGKPKTELYWESPPSTIGSPEPGIDSSGSGADLANICCWPPLSEFDDRWAPVEKP